jgi:hypothetical protein
MTTAIDLEDGKTIDALARGRYALMQRANTLMGNGDPSSSSVSADQFLGVSGLLMTSLEELKVAEEELRVQNAALIEQRAENDERLRYYRQNFLYAPVPILITDLFGSINEANLAAGSLFRRAPDYLKRKPLAALATRSGMLSWIVWPGSATESPAVSTD